MKFATFVTGYDHEKDCFTLTSIGEIGKPNVEEFDDVMALDFKVEELERNGCIVSIGPCNGEIFLA